MTPMRCIPVVVKQLWRHRVRTGLTLAGVAVAMFLFIAVQTLQQSVRSATHAAASDVTLVVFRQNRYCPATSRLPESYAARIGQLPGVASVLPVSIVVSNCRASLDVVTFRGVPQESLIGSAGSAERWQVLAGSLEEWRERSDAALVGEALAVRRGFKVGDSFSSAGVTATVAAIIRSTEPQEQNVAYVHLDFLQRAAGGSGGVGRVTQFTVRVKDPAMMEGVAVKIDELFRDDPDPTATRPEKAFVARAAADVVQLVGFTRWLGWGCLAAIFALLGNSIMLTVQDRIREHALFQALGFRESVIATLIVGEGMLLGVIGGATGAGVAWLIFHLGQFSLSQEGLSIQVTVNWSLLLSGLILSAGVGVAASLLPAWRARRREIAASLRAV